MKRELLTVADVFDLSNWQLKKNKMQFMLVCKLIMLINICSKCRFVVSNLFTKSHQSAAEFCSLQFYHLNSANVCLCRKISRSHVEKNLEDTITFWLETSCFNHWKDRISCSSIIWTLWKIESVQLNLFDIIDCFF